MDFKLLVAILASGGGIFYWWYKKQENTENTVNEINAIQSDTVDSLIPFDINTLTDLVGMGDSIAVRNNNPLNIRETGDEWQGLTTPRAKNGFFNFKAPEWGFRAAKIIILNAYSKLGVNTVRGIISKWAPVADNNDVENYINFVSKKTGFTATTKINSSNIAQLLYAMAILESGKTYSMDIVNKGINL